MKPKEVEQLIQRGIWDSTYSHPRVQDGKVHIGCIVYECERRCVYASTVPTPFFNVNTTMNFWYGNAIHAPKLLPLSTQEFTVSDGDTIGHVDEFAQKIEIGLEKKSTSTYKPSPIVHHNRQAEYYEVMLKNMGFKRAEMFVTYFLKTMDSIWPSVYGISVRSFQVVLDEIRHKTNVVKLSRKCKILPKPTYCDECGDCPYTSLCVGDLLTIPKETLAYYLEQSSIAKEKLQSRGNVDV